MLKRDIARAVPVAPPIRTGGRGLGALALLQAGNTADKAIQTAGFANLGEVLSAVAEHFRLPRLELDSMELGPELALLVPKEFAERHKIVPVFVSAEEIGIATFDPTRLELFDWLVRTVKRPVTTVIAGPQEIERAYKRLYERLSGAGLDDDTPEDISSEALAEAVQVVERLITGAVEAKASDIHIEATERESTVRFRIDGVLRQIDSRPIELHAAIISRVKVLAEMDIAVRLAPQDGRIKLKRARGDIDLRVSTLPTYFGEKVCLRILDNQRASLALDSIGFERDQIATFESMIRAPYGLLLVTGPTGSGKSTTLYAALNAVKSPEINVVSVEDPIEYQIPGINQVQVNAKRGVTFATALRSILRQDPNVILVGEVRDRETGLLAAEAALTGHMVMTSLHTNDAASAIVRLTELGVEPHIVAPSLVGVIAQRLMRKVCDACATDYAPTEAERVALGLPELPEGVRFRRGAGCAACSRTGYLGRIAVRELLPVDDELRALVAAGVTSEDIRGHADRSGFRSMRHQGLRRLFAGQTTFAEVIRVTRA